MVGAGYVAKAHSAGYAGVQVFSEGGIPSPRKVRIADVCARTAHHAATQFGWNQWTSEWRDITRAPDIDLVDIVTPNNVHADIAIDAAEHGKSVLCEKPLADTLSAARRMYEAVQKAGVRNQIAFVYRTWPAVVLAKELVDQGAIGRLLRFRGQYLDDSAAATDARTSWRFRPEAAGAGSIADLGAHVIDLARYFGGDVRRVFARTQTLPTIGPTDARSTSGVQRDDHADLLLEFETGASGMIETNRMALGHKCVLEFEVSGNAGTIRFSWSSAGALRWYSVSDRAELRGFREIIIGPKHRGAGHFWNAAGEGMGYGDAFVIAVQQLLGAIGTNDPASPGFLDGLRVSEIIDASLEAARLGRWTNVERKAV